MNERRPTISLDGTSSRSSLHIGGPILALAPTEPVIVPVRSVLWLDD